MAIEQLQNTPAIGDIVLDPSEKFADLDGKVKFDLLLADGSVVDETTHPVLFDISPITQLGNITDVLQRESLFSCYAGGSNNTHLDYEFSNPASPSHAVRYGNTYEAGLGGFVETRTQQESNYAELNTTSVDASELVYPLWLEASIGTTWRDAITAKLVWYASDDSVIYVIELFRKADFKVGMRTSKDGVTFDTKIGSGSTTENARGTLTLTGDSMSWVGVPQQNYVLDWVDQVPNITNAAYFTFEATAYSDFHYGQVCALERSIPGVPLLPNLTSPDPACPYRVVADLT